MSTIKVTNIQDTSGDNSSTSEELFQGRAKAWVNFDGTFGTSPFTEANGGIRDSFNVTSITDGGTGLYTVNYTNSLSNANYAWVGQIGYSGDNTNSLLNVEALSGASNSYSSTTTTSLLKVETVYVDAHTNRTRFDPHYVAISVFGD